MYENDQDNPIKEYKPFRFGTDILEENFEINSEYSPTDLHNCSNDLSDKGSRKEEFEHAKFADNIRNLNKEYEWDKFEDTKKINVGEKISNILLWFIGFCMIAIVLFLMFFAFFDILYYF